MTNKFTHHYNLNIFLPQPDTKSVQQFPTPVPVEARERTDSHHTTGKTRLIPLDVESLDTSRNLARLPADPVQRLTASGPMQTQRRQQGRGYPLHNGEGASLVRFNSNSRIAPSTNSKRAYAQAYTQTQKLVERTARIDPDTIHSSQEHAQRPPGGVRQDKDRISCDRVASPQPAAVNKFTRSQATRRNSPRLRKENIDNRRTVPVQVWVSPLVKSELSRIASSDGLSLSSAGAALLERGIQQNVDMQYSALLRPIIEDTIAKSMAGIATRLTWLLVRIAFDAGQTRSLVTNILGRQPGVTQPLLRTILNASARSAKANIMRRTPPISELINSVEQWMLEESRGDKDQKS